MASTSDTDPAVTALQIKLLRDAGTGRRGALALSLSQTVIEMSRQELRRRMPEASEQEIRLRWAELNYGAELAARLRAALATRG